MFIPLFIYLFSYFIFILIFYIINFQMYLFKVLFLIIFTLHFFPIYLSTYFSYVFLFTFSIHFCFLMQIKLFLLKCVMGLTFCPLVNRDLYLHCSQHRCRQAHNRNSDLQTIHGYGALPTHVLAWLDSVLLIHGFSFPLQQGYTLEGVS